MAMNKLSIDSLVSRSDPFWRITPFLASSGKPKQNGSSVYVARIISNDETIRIVTLPAKALRSGSYHIVWSPTVAVQESISN